MQVRLRQLRLARGLSQMELAARSGVSQSQISSIESGETKNPSIGVIVKLAKALDVHYTELIDVDSESA